MEITKTYSKEQIESVNFSDFSCNDDTDYILSNPATLNEILEGLSTSWEDCVSEKEVLKMFIHAVLINNIAWYIRLILK